MEEPASVGVLYPTLRKRDLKRSRFDLDGGSPVLSSSSSSGGVAVVRLMLTGKGRRGMGRKRGGPSSDIVY